MKAEIQMRCAQAEFLKTLEALIEEARGNENGLHEPNYWKERKDAFLEVRQLWRETIGG